MSIPTNLRVPFFAVEIDNSRAEQGPALLQYRGLLIGQKTAAGTASANSLHRVTSAEQVSTLAGRGSMLHRQAKAWFAANKFTELYIGVLEDNGAGVAASGKIVFAGTATEAGTVSLYAGGELVEVAVASGDTAADVADAVAAKFPSTSDYPVTAAVDGSVDEEVDFTFRHKGAVGNEYDLRLNYQDGEELPAGITATITALASGATNPSLTSLISAMGDTWFHVIAHPYTDSTSLTALEGELEDRSGPLRMIEGHAFTAKSDTHSNLSTLGNTRNSEHSSIVAAYKMPTPPFEVAANVAATVAYYGNIDPARPFQTLALGWCKAPAEVDRFTLEERNLLLFDGVSTLKVAAGGTVQVERLMTTYQTNAAGAADASYAAVETMLTLMYLRYALRTWFASKFPRHKLADDGVQVAAGQAVVTPKTAKAECVAWFQAMENLGLVGGIDQFKRDLVVSRDETDRNRLNMLVPPDLMNQLIVTAMTLQFRL
jgi:phage tail sheath gpL-like